MSLNRKSARQSMLGGAFAIAVAMVLDVAFGQAPIATTGALILLVGGVVFFLIGLTWFIRNPMARKR